MKIIVVGIGAIGRAVAEYVKRRPDMRLVGVFDVNTKATLDSGHEVQPPEEALIKEKGAALAFHCTSSWLPGALPQLKSLVRCGVNVISSCEELSWPWQKHAEAARQLHDDARRAGVRLLGTGVNPGFAMDTMALIATSPCQSVRKIEVSRIMNAATKRAGFQKKVGVGMTEADFQSALSDPKFGHIGLPESAYMVAAGLGWHLDTLDEEIRPVVSPDELEGGAFPVQPGMVCGLKQTVQGWMGGEPVLRMSFEAYLGAADPRDEVIVTGHPSMRLVVPGGIPGDVATASILVNAAMPLMKTSPGLRTMLDLPTLRWSRGDLSHPS